jgi:two-component system, NarL family, nitrate/nitrite response regulator NarL
MNETPVRIFIVDDHALFRHGLASLLAEMPEFVVVGDASNGKEALERLPASQADVVLLDLNMPEMDGIAVLQEIKKQKTRPHILMLTISKTDEDLIAAITAGADGYLLKNTEPDDLRKAILQVASGQGVLSPEVTAPILRAVVNPPRADDDPTLSDREREVLDCLANGMTTSQIAVKLFISDNTVRTHVRHILEKLESVNRTAAVSKAIQLGLIHKNSA